VVEKFALRSMKLLFKFWNKEELPEE